MRVVPHSSTLLSVSSEHLLATVGDRGSVNVPSLARARDLLPRTKGARTATGEVWRTLLPGVAPTAASVEQYSYTLGFARAVAEVHLDAVEGVTEPQLLGWLDGIDVEWSGR